MKAIEEAGEMSGHKSKIEAAKEAIEKRDRLSKLDKLDEDEKMMIDDKKVKEMANEKKALEKYLAKLQKQLDKLESKINKGEKVEDTEKEEIVDETMMDENDPENGPQLEEEYDTNIYEMLHMQKLAGTISESEYKVKVEEVARKKASAGMTKKEKSSVVKKARAGKDIGKKGKGFEDVAKAAGGGEKGKKIAAAAMWKGEAKKAKGLKEQVLALFEGEYSDWWAKADDELGLDFGDDIYSYVDSYDEPWQGNFANEVVNIDADNYEDFKNQVKQLYDEINPF
jgi:hypothetical protein